MKIVFVILKRTCVYKHQVAGRKLTEILKREMIKGLFSSAIIPYFILKDTFDCHCQLLA